jgi:hypothetical protein
LQDAGCPDAIAARPRQLATMQRRPRGVSQAFRDEAIDGEYEETKDDEYDDDDELPRSTSFMANNLTRTLLAASERNPTSYMSKAMSTQGRAAKTFAKEFNPEPSKKQYNKARGLGKTATVVTTQLTSIYNALKGKDGLATSRLGDAIRALDLKYAPPPGAIHPQEAAATFLTELALDPSQALDEDAFIGAAATLRPEAIRAAAGPRNAKRLQKKMRADPFAIMRRKQSRAQAFDFKKEAETGKALAHTQRLEEEVQASHVSEEFLELPEEKKDERRLQRKLRRMEIEAIKADRKDLERWQKEDEARKEAVQKKLEMIEKLRKSGEVISDKEAAMMVASIPPLRPRPQEPLPLPSRKKLHERTLEGHEVADKADQSRFEAAHRSYYEASSVPEAQVPLLKNGPVDHVTRNMEAVTLRSSGSVPLMDALALERESKATRVNLMKREELDLRMELPLRHGFDATSASIDLPAGFDASALKEIRVPPPGAASGAPRGGPRELIVQEARRAEREAIRKRKAEARLAERVSMAISNVQKHGIEERLEEVQHEQLSNAIRLVDGIRREEFDREEKIHLERERASKERAAERRRLKEELERDVELIRNSEMDRVLALRSQKAPFTINPGMFDSTIPPETDESKQRRKKASLLSEWREAVEAEKARVQNIRSTNLQNYFDARASPFIGEPSEWKATGSPVRTASSLVDGTGVFVEESAEPAENELYPTFSRASTRGSLKTRGSVDSWTITDGGARSETVTPAALPPAMVAADRIFRPKRRVQTVYL